MTPHSRGEYLILIAEDEPLVRNLIRSVLTAHGYGVIDAADGQEALELSRGYAAEIHMLLTDVRMPRMDGVELSEKIRSEPAGHPGFGDVCGEFRSVRRDRPRRQLYPKAVSGESASG